MSQYDSYLLRDVKDIVNNGTWSDDRTSVGRNKKQFGHTFRIPIPEMHDQFEMPFQQSRAFAPRIAFEELMWMLRGETDSYILKDKGINIWDANTSREFLDKKGLYNVNEGDIGKGYGYQMRNFHGVDQLRSVYNSLRDNPTSRYHLINLWNPAELSEMALPPCHYAYTFCVTNEGKTLNLHQSMRSSDVLYGRGYNVAFASMWLVFFAQALDMQVGEIFFTATDSHIYENQMDLANRMLNTYGKLGSITFTPPLLKVNKELTCLNDVLDLEWSDIEISGFKSGPKFLSPEMAT
jgi:thymidylate synthase